MQTTGVMPAAYDNVKKTSPKKAKSGKKGCK